MTLPLLARAGDRLTAFIVYVGELAVLWGRIMFLLFTTPLHWYRFLIQARRVGLGSFFISSLVAFFIGIIIALQMAYLMMQMSAEIYIPKVIAVSMARELAPVLTALIVAGRIGAGITAEIGSMVATEQVDALKAFAVDPLKYLAVPRFLSLVVMLPLLAFFATVIGIVGGCVICYFKLSLDGYLYWQMVCDALVPKDILTGLIKTLFFAMIIALVGCLEGLKVRGGADGVGRATTVAVVRSFVLIIASDCFFTFIFYFVFNI